MAQIAALIGFFPVVINTAVGLTQVDDEMLDLGRVFGAPTWKVFLKIRLPNALPYVLSALKIPATAAMSRKSLSGLARLIVVEVNLPPFAAASHTISNS